MFVKKQNLILSKSQELSRGIATVLILLMSAPSVTYASGTVSYLALYCSSNENVVINSKSGDRRLSCSSSSNSNESPSFETEVNSLSTNPNGDHAVTIVKADCFPGVPQVSSGQTSSIHCGPGIPDATLTKGSSFPAASKPTPSPPPSSAISIAAPGNLPNRSNTAASSAAVEAVLGIAFGAIGAVALLMIVVSGLRYVVSGGSPERMKQARDGIIYALVGLTVAITAEAIIGFVVGYI
jgi:hypothetical protein